MTTAISIGTTGLTASSKQMDVIGNNLANSNTLGYKAGSAFFESMLNQSIAAGGSMQVGSGVSVASIGTQFQQGSFETTGNATDLAIDGEGFFIVTDPEGGTYYTRAGNFHISKEGYLVDSNGYKVQGYGKNNDNLQSISLKNVQSEPSATKTFSMGVNLNDSAEAGTTFTVSQNVYDSKGQQHTLSTTYQKTEKAGYWGFTVVLDGNNISSGQSGDGIIFDENGSISKLYKGEVENFTVNTANDDDDATAGIKLLKPGQIYKNATSAITLKENGDGTGVWSITSRGGYDNATISTQEAGKIKIDLDGEGGADIEINVSDKTTWEDGDTISFSLKHTPSDGIEDQILSFATLTNGATIGDNGKITWQLKSDTINTITSYASASVVQSLSDDGYPSGVLKSVDVGKDGGITGYFTNGQTSQLGKILLANFPDAGELKKVGNYFAETISSGQPLINTAGTAGLGEVISNTLELSNVDTAKEFINMITAQRAYQANARVITTANDMLTELMNIKR